MYAKALCSASGGLISFLETTAIRHAPENSRDGLRIVHKAEACEDLILVIHIKSTRVSKALRFSLNFGELLKFDIARH